MKKERRRRGKKVKQVRKICRSQLRRTKSKSYKHRDGELEMEQGGGG